MMAVAPINRSAGSEENSSGKPDSPPAVKPGLIAEQCKMETVVTSKLFMEKLASINKIDVPARTIFLEDVLAGPRSGEKIIALLLAIATPYGLMKRFLGSRKQTTDDLATIIFSSGSTGDPRA